MLVAARQPPLPVRSIVEPDIPAADPWERHLLEASTSRSQCGRHRRTGDRPAGPGPPAQASGPTAVTASPAATSRPDKSFGPAQRRAAIAAAKADRADTAGKLRLGAKEALVVKDVLRDTDGTEHVRYNRTYDGLPVIGGDLVVQQSPGGKIAVDRANEPADHRCRSGETRASPAPAPARSRSCTPRSTRRSWPGRPRSPARRRTAPRSATSSTPTPAPASGWPGSRRSWTRPAPASRCTAAPSRWPPR